MIQTKDTDTDFIYHNLLDEEMQKKVSFLEQCLERRKSLKNKGVFNIFIENMSQKEIHLFVEYLNQLFIEKDVCSNITTIHDLDDISDYQNEVLFLPVDEIESFSRDWRHLSNDVIHCFHDAYDHNNILIVAAVKPFQEYTSLEESQIEKIAPAFHFHFSKDLDSIYQNLLNRFQNEHITCTLSREDLESIYDEIQDNDYILHFNLDEYLYDYAINSNRFYEENMVTIHTYSKLLKEEENDAEESDEKKLDLRNLVGLKNVKNELNSLFHYASFLKKMNIDKSHTYLNMFFLGNPGTGKTMVANIIADRLYELGYLESKEIVKVVPNDLIGEYVGHTKKNIRNILNKAKGKLLFIDEAYLIGKKSYSHGYNPFMEEAVVELLKYLEDPSNIVIFAGYKEEMRELYQTNPGLKSRIYKEIFFEDYSTKELFKILEDDLKEKGLVIEKHAKIKYKVYIQGLKNEKSFGNARSMLQLSQKILMNHADHCTKENQFILDEKDLPIETNDAVQRMGFGAYDGR